MAADSESSSLCSTECPPTKESVEVGMKCAVKRLYAEDKGRKGYLNWMDIPDAFPKPVEDDETAEYTLVVRLVPVYDNPRKPRAIHSIVVHSPLLKNLLGVVLEGYPGVTVTLKRLQFSGRLEPLIHRWAKLEDVIARLPGEDRQTREHAELLLGVLRTEFGETIREFQDEKLNHVISYKNLWLLLVPATVVVFKEDGQETAMMLESSMESMDQYSLLCKYVDWDGSKWGTCNRPLLIWAYNGTRLIADLTVYPIDHHPNEAELRQRLIKRGDKIQALTGSHYKEYDGTCWSQDRSGRKHKLTVKGRVVIDTEAWNTWNPDDAVIVMALSLIHTDGQSAGKSAGAVLTREQKLICTSTVRGYSIKFKRWLSFSVDSVKEIKWNIEAFNSLVLPPGQKEFIWAITNQRQTGDSFDDLIPGKGKGITLLFHGSLGTGKTLTAESIAEKMRVPLLIISAGDLGLDPPQIESKLHEILEICAKWRAILLLNEADIFLEQRSLYELERNKLVTVFLRILEYFDGILFLTTNRVEVVDCAFQSRIHCSIEYPELDSGSRRMVWKNLIVAAKLDPRIDDDQIGQLAQTKINGRDIKNKLQIACMLAEKEEVEYNHIVAALNVSGRFATESEPKGKRVQFG